MSRYDRLINLALVVAWLMVAYRFANMYYSPESASAEGDDYAEPSLPPPVSICDLGSVCVRHDVVRACGAPRAHEERLCASHLYLTDPPPAPPQPTPTSIPGPQQMRPLVGKCFYVSMPGQPIKFEVCGYRTVRQIMTEHYQVFVTGRWTGKWITREENGKTKYVGHHYENGDMCPNIGPRHTSVEFRCAAGATTPQLVTVSEPEPCHYKVVVGVPQWCEMEKAGLTAKPMD